MGMSSKKYNMEPSPIREEGDVWKFFKENIERLRPCGFTGEDKLWEAVEGTPWDKVTHLLQIPVSDSIWDSLVEPIYAQVDEYSK